MGWKQQKKIWAEYPYLVDDAFHMSMKQAMERQTAEGYPAFEEMVKAAKARSDLPASAWLPVDRVIAGKSKKDGAWMHSHWNTIRRLAVACLCIVLIAGYLCFAPAGKAFAASIAKMVMQLMDNGIRYTPTAPATSSDGTSRVCRF